MTHTILAIDSSGPYPTVCLGSVDQNYEISGSELSSAKENSHNEKLPELIERALKESNLKMDQLTALAIGSGPGSFTGLRIGYSIAKGIAQAAGKELISIPTYRACALEFCTQHKLLFAVGDARRNEFFCSIYECSKENLPVVIEENLILDCAGIQKLHADYKSKFGLDNSMIGFCAHTACDLPFEILLPVQLGLSVLQLANRELKLLQDQGKKSIDLKDLVPLYVREVAAKTIAEREREKQQI